MRHPMHAGDEQRVHGTEGARGSAQRRHWNGARRERLEGQRVRKHARVGDLPVQVEMVEHAPGPALHIVPLRLRQLGIALERTAPASRGQHFLGALQRCAGNQQVDVEPGTEVRFWIHGVREAGPLEHQCVDSACAQSIEQFARDFLAPRVQRRCRRQPTYEARALRRQPLRRRERPGKPEIQSVLPAHVHKRRRERLIASRDSRT